MYLCPCLTSRAVGVRTPSKYGTVIGALVKEKPIKLIGFTYPTKLEVLLFRACLKLR